MRVVSEERLRRGNYFGPDDRSFFAVFYTEIPDVCILECIIEWQATCAWQRLIKQPIMRLICRTRRRDGGPDAKIRNYIFVPMMTNVRRPVYIDDPASTFTETETLGTFITRLRWKTMRCTFPDGVRVEESRYSPILPQIGHDVCLILWCFWFLEYLWKYICTTLDISVVVYV